MHFYPSHQLLLKVLPRKHLINRDTVYKCRRLSNIEYIKLRIDEITLTKALKIHSMILGRELSKTNQNHIRCA